MPCTCNRRIFLKNSAMALVSLGLGPRFLTRAAYAASSSGAGKVLVAIFQRGAADGLNMVVPFSDPNYSAARGAIRIPPPGQSGGAIDLDGRFGLHPALQPLKSLYNSKQLAIVHACGSPDPSRSHFDAQDYMETGTPGQPYPDGWLNRHLQTQSGGGSIFRATSMTSDTPRILGGSAPVLAINSLEDLQFSGPSGDLRQVTIERMYGRRDDLLGRTTQEALRAVELAAELDPAGYAPAHGAQYPEGVFGAQLKNIAQIIKADVGLEIAFANLDGWDTHSNQGAGSGVMAVYLDDLATSLAAFHQDLGDRMEDVCVLTMSEFGRTVEENGSGGTDHGHATAMFVLGGSVKGGTIYGDWPGLEREQLFEGRDLAVTTDFRNLFAEIVVKHLGNNAVDAVFPGFHYNPAAALNLLKG